MNDNARGILYIAAALALCALDPLLDGWSVTPPAAMNPTSGVLGSGPD